MHTGDLCTGLEGCWELGVSLCDTNLCLLLSDFAVYMCVRSALRLRTWVSHFISVLLLSCCSKSQLVKRGQSQVTPWLGHGAACGMVIELHPKGTRNRLEVSARTGAYI